MLGDLESSDPSSNLGLDIQTLKYLKNIHYTDVKNTSHLQQNRKESASLLS